jgi:hypothetical protein
MVTHVTEFCWRFPHNVINATKGETGAINIDYVIEESWGPAETSSRRSSDSLRAAFLLPEPATRQQELF